MFMVVQMNNLYEQKCKQECKHPTVKFIGIQEGYESKKILFLYNCLTCHTTISTYKKGVLNASTRIQLEDKI